MIMLWHLIEGLYINSRQTPNPLPLLHGCPSISPFFALCALLGSAIKALYVIDVAFLLLKLPGQTQDNGSWGKLNMWAFRTSPSRDRSPRCGENGAEIESAGQ